MSNNNKIQQKSREPFGYVINDNGEEIPITDEMITASMVDIKLQSIGTHTGYNKAITDDMLPPRETENT